MASDLARYGPPVRTERLTLPDGKEIEVRFYARRGRVLLDGIWRLLGRPIDTGDSPVVIAQGMVIGGQALYKRLTNDHRVTGT